MSLRFFYIMVIEARSTHHRGVRRRHLALGVLGAAVVALVAGSARAETDLAAAARLPIRVFRDRDGLPQNAPMALAFDPRGVLWIGTQDGLASFDGRGFSTFNVPKRAVSNFIHAVLVDGNGAVWCGRQDGGVVRFKDGVWSSFDAASGLPADRVDAIAETVSTSGARSIWVATPRGLARRDGDRWSVFGTADGLPSEHVGALLAGKDDDGAPTLYVGTSAGVARLDGDRFVSVLGTPSGAVTAMLQTTAADGTRALWIGVHDALLARHERGAWTIFGVGNGLPDHDVTALAETTGADDTRTLWVGTDGAVVRRVHDQWLTVPTDGVLPSSSVWSFLAAPARGPTHTLWLGVDGGLARMRLGGWRTFARPEATSSTYAILVTRDESQHDVVWIGTRGNGLLRLSNGKWSRFDKSSGLPDDTVFSLAEIVEDDGTRALWVGTQGAGLARFANDKWSAPLWPDSTVRQLHAIVGDDGKPTLYAATGNRGVRRYAHGSWTAIDTHAGLPTDATFDVAETRAADGRAILWVATQGAGLARRDRGVWTTFDKTNSPLLTGSVISLHVARSPDGRDESLWAGTEGGGVAVLDLAKDDAAFTILTEATQPSLPNDTVYQVQSDRRGRVYLFTNKGVARLTRRAPTPDDPSPFHVRTFTTEDGLPSNEFNGGASFADDRGRIWAGTVSGVTFYDPSAEVDDEAPARLDLAPRLLRSGAVFAPNARLAYDESSLAFEYALVRLFRGTETRYRTQLAGLDPGPSDWSVDAKREYTTLPEGAYVFNVWAKDFEGNVIGPMQTPFRVEPAPWRTWWAVALYAVVLAALAYALVRYRMYALERRNVLLETKIGERTAELGHKVDELAASETRARAAEEDARRADRAQSMFLSTMSHELRTPLNAILGFAQLLSRDRALPPAHREDVDVIRRSGEHLLGLINDVLSIAKIEAGMVVLDERAFRLEDVVRGVKQMMEPRAKAKRLRLLGEIAPGAPAAVRGDEQKLRQILINLVGNAVTFTQHGGVALRASWKDGRAIFEIEDSGPGIAPTELAALFAPFVQSATGRGAGEGTGLGLVISRSYAQRMGGDVTATSAVGKGTTFRCEVALTAVDESDAPPVERKVIAIAPGCGPYKVLIADDVADNRTLLARLLAAVGGFDVREAANGAEAVATWESFAPDLVFMDVRMEGVDGAAATRKIREKEPARKTKIVALSASAFEHERAALIAGGCDAFVAKPYRESTIFETIEAQLGATFVFADDSATTRTSADVATRERLAALPDALRTQLHAAARAGDLKRARDAVDSIADIDAELGRSLRDLIDAFLLEEIEGRMERDAGDESTSAHRR